MQRKQLWRRILSFTLIALGGFLIFLAPAIVPGLYILAAGILVEPSGITLDHRS